MHAPEASTCIYMCMHISLFYHFLNDIYVIGEQALIDAPNTNPNHNINPK